MRVLRLGLGDDQVVDLHPSVSVVTGLSDRQRTTLRRAFSAIGTGLVPAVPGLLEAHGLLLDATQDDLDLLDVPRSPAATVVAAADVPGAVPEEGAARLRTAERDLLALASDRSQPERGPTGTGATTTARNQAHLQARAAELQARIGRHRARDAEPVRVALDGVRDQQRAGTTPRTEQLAGSLADIGLDVTDLGLPVAEAVRLAEDWLDERQREAAGVVGAEVELQGIEDALAGPHDDPPRRAVEAQVGALEHVDELRTRLVADHAPRPTAEQLAQHLSTRLADHRPDRLAGAVPLLLDGLLTHLEDADVVVLLDRFAALAGSVQLVVVDEHRAVRDWARSAGAHRAAVVGPSSSPVSGVPA